MLWESYQQLPPRLDFLGQSNVKHICRSVLNIFVCDQREGCGISKHCDGAHIMK